MSFGVCGAMAAIAMQKLTLCCKTCEQRLRCGSKKKSSGLAGAFLLSAQRKDQRE